MGKKSYPLGGTPQPIAQVELVTSSLLDPKKLGIRKKIGSRNFLGVGTPSMSQNFRVAVSWRVLPGMDGLPHFRQTHMGHNVNPD